MPMTQDTGHRAGQATINALGFVWHNRLLVVRICGPFVLLYATIDAIAHASATGESITVVSLMVSLLLPPLWLAGTTLTACATYTVIAQMRQCDSVLSIWNTTRPGAVYSWSRVHTRMMFWNLGITAIMAIGTGLSTAVGFLLPQGVLAMAITIPIVILVVLALARICLILPATALAHNATVQDCWQRSAGHQWFLVRFTFIISVLMLITSLATGLLRLGLIGINGLEQSLLFHGILSIMETSAFMVILTVSTCVLATVFHSLFAVDSPSITVPRGNIHA